MPNLSTEQRVALNAKTKKSFGEKFRLSRDAAGYSRAKLGIEISVSAKTIQSWEEGRTFPENLGLFPVIRDKLGFNVTKILGETLDEQERKLLAVVEVKPKIVRKAASVDNDESSTE